MSLTDLLRKHHPAPTLLPGFIRAVEDIGAVRVIRLQGDMGKGIGREVSDHVERLREEEADVFDRSLLLDYEGTAQWDFSTVAYLVEALRRRMDTSARVGLINAPKELLDELDLAKLRELFVVYASEQEALAALSSNASSGS